MKQPPRKPTDRLTTWRLFVLTYFQLGIYETVYCFLMYFIMFAYWGFPITSIFFTANWYQSDFGDMAPADQNSCNQLAANNLIWQAQQSTWSNFDAYRFTALQCAQTVYLASITFCQLGNVLGAKTQFASIFQVGIPNWKIPIAQCIAITFSMLLTYTPIGWVIFGTHTINGIFYAYMLGGPVMMLLYHEIIKVFLRRWPQGWVAFFLKY